MIRASAAQARLLSVLADTEAALIPSSAKGWKRGRVHLCVMEDRAPSSALALIGDDPDLRYMRPVGVTTAPTVAVCMREGWIAHDGTTIEGGGIAEIFRADGYYTLGGGRRAFVEWWEPDLTDDGRIALGRWRAHALASPTPIPSLAEDDRRVLALAAAAERDGYALSPASGDAKAQARRLTREGWAVRNRVVVGASTSTVSPSALAAVEVEPHLADSAAFSPKESSQ